jgi:hypothetical protein
MTCRPLISKFSLLYLSTDERLRSYLGLHFLWLVSLLHHWISFCYSNFSFLWQTNYPHHSRLKVWIVTQNGGRCLIDLAPPHHKPQDVQHPKVPLGIHDPIISKYAYNLACCHVPPPPLHKHSCPNQRCNMGKMGWSGDGWLGKTFIFW